MEFWVSSFLACLFLALGVLFLNFSYKVFKADPAVYERNRRRIKDPSSGEDEVVKEHLCVSRDGKSWVIKRRLTDVAVRPIFHPKGK